MIVLKRSFFLMATVLVLGACGQSRDGGEGATYLDVAQAAAREADRVSVEELAQWLIEERQDFELIDVRSPEDVEQGQIGEARNIPIVELVTSDGLASLPTDRKVVLYSNGSENGAKASVLLRLAGFDALVLTGGYNAWQQRILNPDIPLEELDGESLLVTEQRAFACYFVGERSGARAERPELESVDFVPPVFEGEEELPPLPPATEEGC